MKTIIKLIFFLFFVSLNAFVVTRSYDPLVCFDEKITFTIPVGYVKKYEHYKTMLSYEPGPMVPLDRWVEQLVIHKIPKRVYKSSEYIRDYIAGLSQQQKYSQVTLIPQPISFTLVKYINPSVNNTRTYDGIYLKTDNPTHVYHFQYKITERNPNTIFDEEEPITYVRDLMNKNI